MPRFAVAWGLLALCTAGASAQSAAAWQPSRNVEVIVQSAAGGSSDRSARVVQKILQTLAGMPSVSVNNKPGGGGNVAWVYLNQHAGDAHFLGTLSSTLLTTHLLGLSPLNYRHFTPLSILLREYIVFAVKSDSPLGSAQDLLERLRKDPSSVSFAYASSRGNHNHVMIGMLIKAAGADPRKAKAVIYNSGGEATAAMLGGHIDVAVIAPANVIPHLGSRARALGVTAPQRQQGGLAAVPTFREQGVDAIYYSWRGFIGAKRLTPAQTAYWDQAFAKLVQAPEWKKDVAQNAWAEDFMGSAKTLAHLETENAMLGKMLLELGVINR